MGWVQDKTPVFEFSRLKIITSIVHRLWYNLIYFQINSLSSLLLSHFICFQPYAMGLPCIPYLQVLQLTKPGNRTMPSFVLCTSCPFVLTFSTRCLCFAWSLLKTLTLSTSKSFFSVPPTQNPSPFVCPAHAVCFGRRLTSGQTVLSEVISSLFSVLKHWTDNTLV